MHRLRHHAAYACLFAAMAGGGCGSAAPAFPLRDLVLDATAGMRPFMLILDARRGFTGCAPQIDAMGVGSLECVPESRAALLRTLRRLAQEVTEARSEDDAVDREWATALIDLMAAPGRRASTDRAIDVLQSVLARDSLNAMALNHMAVVFGARALAREDPRDLFLALDYVERAFKVDSLDPAVMVNRALLLDELGAADMALAAWQAVTDRGAHDWRSYANNRRSAIEARRAHDRPIAWPQFSLTETQRVREFVLTTLLAAWASAGLAGQDSVVLTIRERIENAGIRTAALNGDSSLHWIAHDLRSAESTSRFRAVEQLVAGREAYERADYEAASRMLEQANHLLASLGDRSLLAWGHLALAASFWSQQRFDDARHQLDQVSTAGRGRRSRSLEAQVDWLGALVRGRGGDLAGAQSGLERSSAAFQSLHEYGNAGYVLASLAEVHALLGRPRAAAVAVHEGLVLSRYVGGARTEQLLSLGQQLLDRGLLHAAGPLLESAVVAAGRATRTKDLPEALARLARLQAQMGNVNGAGLSVVRTRQLLDGIASDAMRRRVAAEADRAEAEALMRTDASRALAALDRARAVFVDIPLERPALRLMRGRLNLLRGERDSARVDLLAALELVKRMQAPPTAASRRALRRDWRDTQRQLAELDLLAGDTIAALVRARALLGMPRAAVHLRATGTPVLGIVALESHLVSWLEGANGAVNVVRVRRNEHEADVTAFRSAIRTGLESPSTIRSAERIYQRTIGAHLALTAGDGAVAIATDETMADVPFSALRDPAGVRLLESLTITRYVPGSTIGASFTGNSADQVLLVVSDPMIDRDARSALAALSWTRREALEVSRLAPSSRLLQGAAATPATVSAGFMGASMLHYAGHAVVEEDVEDESYLVLSPDSARGGRSRLTASAIAGMNLGSMRLAVLAACGRTWRGGRYNEAVNELVLAFLDGGARAVIAGLWEVEDEGTSTLSVELHRRLADGSSPAEALRAAQIQLLERGISSGVVFAMVLHER